MKNFSSTQAAYLAGFLDGDGSIYVRLKPNSDYRYGFQIAPYVVFFQSSKDRENFEKICNMVGSGYLRERNDGMLEYVLQRQDAIRELLSGVKEYLVLKREHADLILEILGKKAEIKSKKDFIALTELVDRFRTLNYSKKRKTHVLTP
jgi:intein-encoded DNA endonuclease-like protein